MIDYILVSPCCHGSYEKDEYRNICTCNSCDQQFNKPLEGVIDYGSEIYGTQEQEPMLPVSNHKRHQYIAVEKDA